MHRVLGVSALLALFAAPLAAQTVRGKVLDAATGEVEALEIFRGPSEIPPQ
jgi:hypothetical protein